MRLSLCKYCFNSRIQKLHNLQYRHDILIVSTEREIGSRLTQQDHSSDREHPPIRYIHSVPGRKFTFLGGTSKLLLYYM